MRPILCGCILVALSAGCASNSAPAAQARGGVGGLHVRQVPTRVGDFRQIDVHRFPQASAGVAYRYSDDSPLRPDVYIYPLRGGHGAEDASPIEQALREGRMLLPALEVERDRGRFDSFELLSDSVVALDVQGHTIEGSHISARLTRGGSHLESHQHIFVVGDRFVKFRSTYPPGAVSLSRLEAFIVAMLTAMTASVEPESTVTL